MMAAVVLMAGLSGCTSTSSPPVVPAQNTPVVTSPPVTTVATSVPTPTAVPIADTEALADSTYVGGLESCYADTPVISNLTSNIAFINCMGNIPDPKGVCAVNYKNNVMRFTKAEDTTAGYAQENTRIPGEV